MRKGDADIQSLDSFVWSVAEILRGDDASERFAHLSAADRAAILEILVATKPDFAGALREL